MTYFVAYAKISLMTHQLLSSWAEKYSKKIDEMFSNALSQVSGKNDRLQVKVHIASVFENLLNSYYPAGPGKD